jgi:8-oxo-dGTP diphosphatase
MVDTPPPNDPLAYEKWIKRLEQDWQNGLVPDPQTVAIILVNNRNEVLLQLRDNDPNISYPNSWTLPGGVVESNENPEEAARRELIEETGMDLQLSLWKMYKRKPINRKLIIQQHVYTGKTQKAVTEMILGEGQALQFFEQEELSTLAISYDFDKLLDEFFNPNENTDE